MSLGDNLKELWHKWFPTQDYGRPHYSVNGLIEIDGEFFLEAINEPGKPTFFYDRHGYVAFGGYHPKFNGSSFVEIDGQTFIQAENEITLMWAFYDRYGHILKDFGGSHYYIDDFFEIDGQKFLKARHEKGGPMAFYDKAGSILKDFGGPHFDIEDFVEIEGKKYLRARHQKGEKISFYAQNGTCFRNEGEFKLVAPYVSKLEAINLSQEYCQVYSMLSNFLHKRSDKDRMKLWSAMNGMVDTIMDRYKDEPETQEQELRKGFEALQKRIREKHSYSQI